MQFLRRNRAFLAIIIPFMVIPWITLGNYHLLMVNFSHERLEILGHAIEMNTYALIAALLLLLLGTAIIVALTLSRFYCGRLCPNTFFSHLLTLFSTKKSSLFSRLFGFLLLSTVSSLFAFSIVAYGISTYELIAALADFTFAGWLVITLSFLMIAEVYMVQGWYCAYLCPYGATCAILPINDRLSYEFNDPNHECTECAGCVKICPIPDLDIRQGFDLRCIQCGLCEVACEKTFAKSPIDSLVQCEERSFLRAGGRDRSILIASILTVLMILGGLILLSDPDRLDSCRLENQNLYETD